MPPTRSRTVDNGPRIDGEKQIQVLERKALQRPHDIKIAMVNYSRRQTHSIRSSFGDVSQLV